MQLCSFEAMYEFIKILRIFSIGNSKISKSDS